MAVRSFIIIFAVIHICASALHSQQDNANYKTYIAKIGNRDTLINLEDKFLIQFSELLTLQNRTLTPLSDYNLDYRNGILILNKDLFQKYDLDTFQIYNLKIDYDVFPYNLKEEYSGFPQFRHYSSKPPPHRPLSPCPNHHVFLPPGADKKKAYRY